MTALPSPAEALPLFRKKDFLLTFSEDDFRDKVVRPLYALKGLRGGRDVCGLDEQGKDCYMFGEDQVAGRILYVIQTKKGDVTMAGTVKATTNLANAITQLRTALETPVKDLTTHTPYRPAFAVLAVSGSVNKSARDHIVDEVKDPRIHFADAESLIPDIDKYMPEFWNGISVAKIPYLRNLKDSLLRDSQTIDLSRIGIGASTVAPVTDDAFAQLYLHRFEPRLVKKAPKRSATKTIFIGSSTTEKIEIDEIKAQDLLSSHQTMSIIMGDAGAGKSTTLRRLAMLLIETALTTPDETRIPVYVYATDVCEESVDLIAHATATTKKLTNDGAAAFTIDDLNEGRVVLLVDAIDEVSDTKGRERVFEKLKKVNAAYDKVQIICTSRLFPSIGELSKKNGVTDFFISPISFRQVEAMIKRLTKEQSLSKEATQEMLRRLENVHGLELNPLLVTVFVASSDYSRSDVPANITELFKKYTEMMLGRWNRDKTVGQQYESPAKDKLLQQVAYAMHEKRVCQFTIAEMREVLQRELTDRGLPFDLDTLYAELVVSSGLMREYEGEVFFRHHMLQEFFAGRGIPSAELLARYATDLWWSKALVFYFGQDADNHAGLAALMQGVDRIHGADCYQAAIVVGLACQACYLMKKEHRVATMTWVVARLAGERDSVIEKLKQFAKDGSLLPFVWYYIYGRDAVATKAISDVTDAVLARYAAADEAEKDRLETEVFWCAAGLIESHLLKKAQEVVKSYRPTDCRHLLALHLGSYCVERLHFTEAGERKIAAAISAKLDPLIDYMRPDFIKEVKGFLLELRDGQVAVVDESEASSPDAEDTVGA